MDLALSSLGLDYPQYWTNEQNGADFQAILDYDDNLSTHMFAEHHAAPAESGSSHSAEYAPAFADQLNITSKRRVPEQSQMQEALMDYENIERVMESRSLKYASIQQAKAALVKIPSDYTLPEDPTRPRDDRDQQFCMALILDAISDDSIAEDNLPLRHSFSKKLQADPGEVEIGAWLLLERVIEYHCRPGHLGSKASGAKKEKPKFQTFSDHIKVLCGVLQRQKTICRHLIQESHIVSFCDDPIGHEKRVKGNRSVNQNKKQNAQYNSQILRELTGKQRNGEDVSTTLQRLTEESRARERRKTPTADAAEQNVDDHRRRKRVKVSQKRGEKAQSHEDAASLLPMNM